MNFKKILATLLAVVMVLGTVSVSFAEDTAIFEIEEVEEIVELFEVEEASEENLAKIGTTGYLSFAEAYEAANDGDTITVLKEVTLTEETTWTKKIALNGATFATAGMLTLADGASLAGENITGTVYTKANATVSVNIPNADLKANGDITFKGDCVANKFDVNYVGTTIRIGKDATLACVGTGRMVIGHGCKFLIEGNVEDAKTATTEDIKPSLTAAGASFTGNGVTFNVTNAYVRFTAYCSSKDKSAYGTHTYNITNSIWDQTGTFVFSAPTSGMDPTFNLTVKDSVFNTTSHIVFAAAKSNVVIDNSIINKDNKQQLENCGNMIIKNGSVVYASDATSSNAKKPGTLTVDNSTYIGNESGEYSGSDLGTGNLILKNDAEVTLGKISNTNITVDTTSCLTTKTIADTCTITIDTEVLNNGKVLDLNESASREGKVSFTKPVASPAKVVYGDDGDVSIDAPLTVIDGVNYYDLKAALKAAYASKPAEINLYNDVVIDYGWDCRSYDGDKYCAATFDYPVTFNGNGHTLKFTGEINDGYNNLAVLRTEADLTVKNLTFDMSEAKSVFQNKFSAISSEGGKLVVENCNFIGNPDATKARAIMYGETNKSAEAVANADVTVTGCTFTNWYNGVVDGENGYDATKVTIENNTFTNANVNISASGKITFNNNTLENGWVHILSYSPVNNLEVKAKGNTLEENGTTDIETNYIKAKDIESDNATFVKTAAMVNGKAYLSLTEAIADAAAKATEEAPVTVQLTAGVHELGTVMFPATAKNIIIKGAAEDSVNLMDATTTTKETVLKNSNLFSSYGGAVDYQNITIENICFDNSYILFTGGRSSAIYKNWTINNCEFYNVEKEAAVAFSAGAAAEAMENFTFTNNVIDGVTGTAKSGLCLRASKGEVIISGNTIKNVNWNAIQCINVAEGTNFVIKDNVLSSGAEEGVLNLANVKAATIEGNTITVNEGQSELAYFTTVAKIGNTYYTSIEAAINGAVEGDVITILAGEYNGFDIPRESANNLTFVGETDAEGNNLVTIKTLEEGIESHNGGIYVGIETATFKNLDFTAGTFAAARLHGMASSLGETNSDTGMRSNLNNLTVENCNFTGSGAYQAIWTNTSNLTIKNSTIKNYNKAFYSVAMSADQRIVVDNTEITDVTYGIHLEETTFGSQVAVTKSAIDAVVIALGGAVAMNITESEISNANVSAWSSTVNISESKLIDTSYGAYGNSTIVIKKNYVNNANELVDNDAITFETYYKSEEDMEKGVLTEVPAVTDTIAVKFVEKPNEEEGEVIYDINLVASDENVINRLNSVDLSFVLNQIGGKNEFEIIKSNSAIAVNSVEHSKTRYEFHFNGKPDDVADTANVITLAQVKFTGYGTFNFAVAKVDAEGNDITTNVVHATKVADNIVDTFVPGGNAANGEGNLNITNSTTGDVTIAVPVRDLTVVVDFPNEVVNKEIAYQAMKVTVTGGDLKKAIEIDLGSDAVETTLDIFGKVDAKYAVTFADGAYTVALTDTLTVNNSYTVTVTGEGYRTARYTVTMTDDKTINFWNNVMDEEHFIEESVDGSKTTKNFLAGDIVKDNKINIYDLSAVVSYFAKENNGADYAKYVKYDLNRDGVIDSKDVAYVLVSWNE